MIKLIGCNNHLGVGEKGLTQNLAKLEALNPLLEILKIDETIIDEPLNEKARNSKSVLKTNQDIAEVVLKVLNENQIPLTILGDHAASIGTVSAASLKTDNLGVIWIDAHPDINTPDTTYSGNIHGMTNAALLDLFDDGFASILDKKPKIKPENLVFIGLRDIDSGEQEFLDSLNITYYTFEDVKQQGLENLLKSINQKFEFVDKLHISLDMDSMNPTLVPAVSVPVNDGFTPQQVSTILDSLMSHHKISSIDIVEYNPAYDKDDKCGKLVLEFIEQIKNHF